MESLLRSREQYSIDGVADNDTKRMRVHRCGQKACVVMILNSQIASHNDKKLTRGIVGGSFQLVVSCY